MKSYRLHSVDWDCPDDNCQGWLEAYGHENGHEARPTIKWVKCSRKCGGRFIISSFQQRDPCYGCKKNIKVVHFRKHFNPYRISANSQF